MIKKKMSFRQKVFVSHLLIFFIFLLLLFPLSTRMVQTMAKKTLQTTAESLILHLQKQSSLEGIIQQIQDRPFPAVLHVELIDDQLRPLSNSEDVASSVKEQLEIAAAFKMGESYSVGWSPVFKCRLAHIATRFDFQGKRYVLKTSFSFDHVQLLMQQFRASFIAIDLGFMVLFTISMWVILSRLSRPIREIDQAIQACSSGLADDIPQIVIDESRGYEFHHLALTLNALTEKIKHQVQTLVDERNEKEAILESLLEGVVAVDSSGKVRYVNQTASKMVAIPRRQLVGYSLSSPHFKGAVMAQAQKLLKLAQEQETVATDSMEIGEGQKIYLDLIAVPKPYQSGAILILQDKSSNHQVVEVGKDFIANASHELRTPITIIKGFAETLQDLPKISPSMLTEITEKIVRNCQRMDSLVKNLLTLADIDNVPESRFQPCDVIALVENCKYLLLTATPHVQMEIVHEEGKISIDADAGLLELALMNLLENGVKYSPSPAHLTLRVEKKSLDVMITIEDRGIGIPTDDLPHIFERFYTVNKAHSRKLGGAGLGLSIVKTIVEKHEGTITVASEAGKGTTFTLLLPKRRHAYHGL